MYELTNTFRAGPLSSFDSAPIFHGFLHRFVARMIVTDMWLIAKLCFEKWCNRINYGLHSMRIPFTTMIIGCEICLMCLHRCLMMMHTLSVWVRRRALVVVDAVPCQPNACSNDELATSCSLKGTLTCCVQHIASKPCEHIGACNSLSFGSSVV